MPDIHTSDYVSLQEYIEARLGDNNRYYDARLAAITEATKLARESMEARLAGMNEFRLALKDQSGAMVTRAELDGIVNGVLADIDALQRAAHIAEGKASQTSVILAALLSAASLVLGIVGLLK